MHNYHRSTGPPRCAMKVDIQKAYDTVDWRFLRDILHGFGFRSLFISWIMECVTTSSFSLSINGNIHGYFKGKRGLRQGDPMSPYLFTMVMEVLTLILAKTAMLDATFRFHNKCEKQMIINLCFADDLFLFARGEVSSVKVIVKSLKEFQEVSGLIPSNAKSTIFYCNVSNSVKARIANLVPFYEGKLPIKYLGVPLLASRLLVKDCKVLVERMSKRIDDWKNRFLSFAGRLQLVVSVLSSIHVYWASVFIIPVSIIKELECKMKWFLWGNGNGSKGRAKVAWKEVCIPKIEGGLGIRRISEVNKSLMAYHIYSLIAGRESLWTNWVRNYRLCGRSIWDVPIQANSPWGWKKLMKCRHIFREFLWCKVGNGQNAFLWFDKWSDECPLANTVTPRQMARYGYSIKSKVADAIQNGVWAWPDEWRTRYPSLFQLRPLNLSEAQDKVLWRNSEGKLLPFSSREAWESIRTSREPVAWANVVWSAFNIPKHAFLCWLIFRRKLWTQDRIIQWQHRVTGSMNQMCCLLCYADIETHDHLFFQCSYSRSVWHSVRNKVDMSSVQRSWDEITSLLVQRAKSKAIYAVGSRLLVAATAYTIWNERNSRFFSNKLRPPEKIVDIIIHMVRTKLISFKYKQTCNVKRFLEE
ncbi:putative RNA-directed DNA polymerase [Helianthus annuus]|nr:putative RNA-directed DNA polymerase [Helianthus annuus]